MFLDFTYQRKDRIIRVPVNVEDLYNVNYVMYKNTHFSEKYFYAFITKLEYINENTTAIYIEGDPFQTWLFDIEIKESYVEREMPVLDNYNTLSDNVAHGQLIELDSFEYTLSGAYFLICSSDITQDTTNDSIPYKFTIGHFTIPAWCIYFDYTEEERLSEVIQHISNKGRGDRIITCVYVPYIANKNNLQTTTINLEQSTPALGTIKVLTGFTDGVNSMSGILTFDYSSITCDYKKELTYPYAKIIVTDTGTGQSIELAPEKFLDEKKAQFQITGTIGEMPTYKITPKNYNGKFLSFEDTLCVRCNTTLATSNNNYSKYLMLNGEMNNLNRLDILSSSGFSLAGSGFSPIGVGATTVSMFTNIAKITASENQAAKLGNQITRFSEGAMERLCFYNSIKVTLLTMDTNHLNMAKTYWKMYGYPTNVLKVPNRTSNNYNYVKLINPNITGNIPQDDLNQIIKIYEEGITLWNDIESFRIY